MKIQMIYNNNMSFILLLFCLWISILSVTLLPVAAAMNAPVGVQQLQKKRQQQQQQQQQQDKEQEGETCGDATAATNNNDECKKIDAATSSSSTTEYDDDNTSSCRFYLSESQVYKGRLGLFATTHFDTGEIVHDDFWVPIRNYNPIEYSMWHDIAISRNDIHQRLRLELDDNGGGADATLELTSFVAGIGSTSRCHDQLANIHPVVQQQQQQQQQQQKDDDQMKQTHDTMMYLSYIATSPIRPGQELFTTCNDDLVPEIGKLVHPIMKPPSALTWYGTCMDRLFVKHSNGNDDNNDVITKNPNPTAHSKRHVSKGQVVASSPIVLIDRSQMEIVQQSYDTTINKVVYTEHVQGYQELLNFCYGHVNSSVLLLPYGPNVYAISHSIQNDNSEQQQLQQPNVKLAWKNSSMHMSHIDYLDMDPLDAMDQDDGNRLIIDYIAIRDIYPGEQLVLDGGLEWQNARKRYQASNNTGSSNDHHHHHHPKNEPIRTVLEQSSSPYPKWIQTTCWYRETMSKGNENNNNNNSNNNNNNSNSKLIWNSEINNDCLRPCHIVERQQIHQSDENKNGENGDNVYVYTVRVTDIPNPLVPTKCKLSNITKGRFVHEVPSEAITFVNKPRSKLNEEEDPKNPVFFRHELAVPDQNFYPTSWYTYNRTVAPMGDFLLPELQEGQIERIRWADTKEAVTSHAYVIGIPSSVRRELMKFCDDMGITERFKDLTYRGNSLWPGEEKEIVLRENSDWLIQRPMSWKSNLHWISPANKASHREYLQALSAGGYDSVLRRVGNYFGFDGLACYHIAFIAVSHSTGGLMHFDVDHTGGKAFAMIVPLILVNGTDPELALKGEEDYQEEEEEEEGDIDDDDDDEEDEGHDDEGNWGLLPRTGGLKYRYEVAAMMGDKAHHSTSSVDYRVSKEMRMAATIYVADINKDNLEAILAETQNYPPRDRPDLLWSMAGRDWKRDDPSVKLPEPTSSNTAAAATCEAEAE